jgi:hypothetical protein
MSSFDKLPKDGAVFGNTGPQKPPKATTKEEIEFRPALEKLADWARKNPGTAGEPASLKDGGPGDSDCISLYLASVLHAGGQRVRLVLADGPPMASGIFVEVFHAAFGKEGHWIAVLPYAPFIFEDQKILKSRRVMEHEL